MTTFNEPYREENPLPYSAVSVKYDCTGKEEYIGAGADDDHGRENLGKTGYNLKSRHKSAYGEEVEEEEDPCNAAINTPSMDCKRE